MNKKNEVVNVLDDFFSEYLPHTKGLSKNTIKSYQYSFQLLFGYLGNVKGLSPDKVTFKSLSDGIIESFLIHLEQERKCSVKTRNTRRAALMTFANFAAKKSFSEALPFYSSMLKTPKKKEPKSNIVKHFTKEEMTILLQLPDTTKLVEQRNVALMSVLYATGARAQELCDITLDGVWLGCPSKIRLCGKNNKTRIVTIPDRCTAILKEYLQSRNLDVKDSSMGKRHLFSSQTNEHMSIACVEEIISKYVRMAKVKYPDLFRQDTYTPHCFRHSIAVHMLESGDSLVAIKAFLGHSSIATTCVYAKVTPELANKYLDERGKPLQNIRLNNAPQPLAQALPFLYR